MQDPRSKSISFTLVGHAHIDPVWLWDWREGYETVRATFRSALDRLRENPDLVFVHSSAAHYAWLEDHPALLAEIRDAVARGQWEPVGGWWVEPDVNLPSGESLARQGLLGQLELERLVGRRARVAFLPDSFGHPSSLPALFRGAGLESFVFMRPGANELELPSNLFWWEGPDGSRVLAARVECYNTSPLTVETSLERNLLWRPPDAPEWIALFGVGNHGGGPTRAAILNVRELNDRPDWPTLAFGSLEGLMERLREREHPVVRGELQHHARGCYSAHSPVKRLNREVERSLLDAERWSALAEPLGLPYPAGPLRDAWKALLFNQFHDVLAGSSLESSYRDAADELGGARAAASRHAFAALSRIASRVDTRREGRDAQEPIRRPRYTPQRWVADLGDGVPVLAFNPSPWPRTEVMEVELNEWMTEDLRVLDHDGHDVVAQVTRAQSASGGRPRVLFTAELPPLGHRLYRVVDEPAAPIPDPGLLVADTARLENRWWRLELDPLTGAVRSLVDKARNLELLAGPGAQLLVMTDPTDTWGHGMTSLRHLAGAFLDPVVRLVEAGPVRATVAVTTAWGGSSARHEISLERDTPAIRGFLRVDWRERHAALKLAFPLALAGTTATFEVPYGHAERPADGQEEPVGAWHDLSGTARDGCGRPHAAGAALLNDAQGGADAYGGELRLTVLRSAVFAHHDPAKLDPDLAYRYQDHGEHACRWRLVPHSGDWRAASVPALAHDHNQPLAVLREYVHAGDLPPEHAFLRLTPPGALHVTAIKRAEDGDDLILRLHEPHGREAEARLELPHLGLDRVVRAGPNALLTLRVGRDGSSRETNLLEE